MLLITQSRIGPLTWSALFQVSATWDVATSRVLIAFTSFTAKPMNRIYAMQASYTVNIFQVWIRCSDFLLWLCEDEMNTLQAASPMSLGADTCINRIESFRHNALAHVIVAIMTVILHVGNISICITITSILLRNFIIFLPVLVFYISLVCSIHCINELILLPWGLLYLGHKEEPWHIRRIVSHIIKRKSTSFSSYIQYLTHMRYCTEINAHRISARLLTSPCCN